MIHRVRNELVAILRLLAILAALVLFASAGNAQQPTSQQRIKVGKPETPKRDTIVFHDTVTLERVRIDTLLLFVRDSTPFEKLVARDTVRDTIRRRTILPIPLPIPLERTRTIAADCPIAPPVVPPTSATPEPSTLVLELLGIVAMIGLAFARDHIDRRTRKRE